MGDDEQWHQQRVTTTTTTITITTTTTTTTTTITTTSCSGSMLINISHDAACSVHSQAQVLARTRDPNPVAGTRYNRLACRFGVKGYGFMLGLGFDVWVNNEFEVNWPVSASAAPMNGFGDDVRSR